MPLHSDAPDPIVAAARQAVDAARLAVARARLRHLDEGRPSSMAAAGARRTGAPVVLVVEDVPDDRELLIEYLSSVGCRVETAENAAEALAQLAVSDPDAIVLDLVLPGGMDGLEVARWIRAEGPSPAVPIVACTAAAHDYLPEVARAVGCDSLHYKPVTPVTLFQDVTRLWDFASRSA